MKEGNLVITLFHDERGLTFSVQLASVVASRFPRVGAGVFVNHNHGKAIEFPGELVLPIHHVEGGFLVIERFEKIRPPVEHNATNRADLSELCGDAFNERPSVGKINVE